MTKQKKYILKTKTKTWHEPSKNGNKINKNEKKLRKKYEGKKNKARTKTEMWLKLNDTKQNKTGVHLFGTLGYSQ